MTEKNCDKDSFSQHAAEVSDLAEDQEAKYCLILISSPTQQRAIFFTSATQQEYWYNTIQKAQGFDPEHHIEQYESLGPLGEGSFGIVVLSQHRYSGAKVAIKIISKARIENTFKVNGQDFQELEILDEVTNSECPNILELIESFEDKEHYYIVTKFMPAGDLYNFLSKQKSLPLNENLTRRLILQVCKGV